MIRVLAILILLAGCNSNPARITAPPVIIYGPKLSQQLPKSLTKCLPEPSGQLVSLNSEAEQYIILLRSAGRDCRAKLKAVHDIVYGPEKR
jgi:hypothetical protein